MKSFLKVVIDIPGSVYEGLDSPERGESRWAQNWAKFLANEGHQVICICNPGHWGSVPPIKNVELRHWSNKAHIDCDIYMNSCWWRGRDIGNVTANLYVHHSYSLEDHMKDPTFITKNHVLAYPYVQSAPNFLHEKNPFLSKTFCMPVPLINEFQPSAFHKKTITFSAKDVFLDRHAQAESHWFQVGRDTIRAIINVSNKYDLPAMFMLAHEITDSRQKAVRDLQLEKLLGTCKNIKKFGLLPMYQVYQVLKHTSVLTPVISPGGTMIEGVCAGIIPLTYGGSLFDNIALKHNFLLSHTASYDTLYNHLESLITDETRYNSILADYQASMVGHLYSSSRNYFEKLSSFRE